MKHLLRMLLAVVFVLSLVACNSSEADGGSAEGGESGSELAEELYLFNWGEYMPQEVLDSFEEEFGVKVVYSTYTSNQEMLTKLNSGTVNYDIVVPTDYIVKRMIEEDQLLEIDMENIPNFKNIQEVFHERDYDPDNKFSVPYLYGSTGIAYNTTKVEGTPTYADLWDEKYAGHVTVQNSSREAFSMSLQKLGYSMNDLSESKIQEAKEELSKLHPNLLVYDESPAAQLTSGEAWISHTYSGEAAIAMEENPDISYLLPEEGGELWMDNLVIPKTSKNKYTAEVFINYLLEGEISKQLSDAFPYSNPNQAALDLMSEEERSNPASYPPQEQIANAEWFEDVPQDTMEMINQAFNELKIE
ncbi:spermidine/putrescine ABC transporter substrate-binding protein [Radiobacillus kanasensis]|uniref:ABC transporter substrate-binding protein n=1 Tax=Radiobacillus kanasensis TaxID=2844358 RepID=UPI001E45441F|nr:spermidine/putrescine ABC transporter substrate-binding protein [Radiobacillus kanasensis]UFT99095.1 spermidine/putrescine ABC transporter substrate-binding protein [Radiobacillus kanasensis]